MSDSKKDLHLLEDEKHLVLDHDYDGIHELNHPLPSWWLGIWIISIVFSIPYFMYYHIAGGDGLRATYVKDMDKLSVIKAEQAKLLGVFDVEDYKTWLSNNDGVKLGATVYEENCLSCHAEGGGGDIGPNLTDKFWINAKDRSPEEIYPVINKGVEENGMPAWGEVLSKEDMYAAMAYVISLKGSTPPKAKEPQGENIEHE